MSRFDSEKDYYSILGAREDASRLEIERLYKRRATERHPDRGGDEEEMKSLNEAYAILRDEGSRRAYDTRRKRTAGFERAHVPVDRDRPPYSSPSAEADMIYGKIAGAIICSAVGLILLFLVRFQGMWFLWPMGVLAFFVILFGVMMARGAMIAVRESFSQTHPAQRYTKLQEALFWSLVSVAGYGVYLLLSAV
ncbi:MAG TPA: J domain-containing protein [Pyrinomonadaceae bacterium]|nr:J domain-containing protein [Pyrinomonadaceae bacterium]